MHELCVCQEGMERTYMAQRIKLQVWIHTLEREKNFVYVLFVVLKVKKIYLWKRDSLNVHTLL